MYWIFITGIATLIAYLFAPSDLNLDRTSFAMLIVLGSTLSFLCVWLFIQGRSFYQKSLIENDSPKVIDFLRSDNYGEEFVFIIESKTNINPGEIAELKRFSHGVEVSFALIEFMEKNSKGQFQAKHIWFSPGHLRDLKLNNFSVYEIKMDSIVHSHTLKKYLEDSK